MIREGMALDREALATILYRASRDVFPLAGIERVDAAEFDRQTKGESILVAEKDDRPVGFSSVWDPDHFLHHFFIDPDHQGQGIGRSLMVATMMRYGSALSLKCNTSNTTARTFYRAMGWIETNEPGGTSEGIGDWIWIRTPAAASALGLLPEDLTE